MINTKEHILGELKKIWTNELYKEFCLYKPIAPENILKDSLLFVGINPSRNKNEPTASLDVMFENNFYHQTQNATYPYFKKFEDISIKVGLEWTHFDLLFMQETKQDLVNWIYNNPQGKMFIEEQLVLSAKLFELCKPKIIIVNNSMARNLMRDNLKMQFRFDENIGTEMYNDIPVFFTSMLTGQRALDNGSYNRLVWHIKRTIEIQNGKSITV